MAFLMMSSIGSGVVGITSNAKIIGTRKTDIIFGYLPSVISTGSNIKTLSSPSKGTGTFVKHQSSGFTGTSDQSYSSTDFYPLIQQYNSNDTLNNTITSSTTQFSSYPAGSYIKFSYILNSSNLDPSCNGETIIRFSRATTASTSLTGLNKFMVPPTSGAPVIYFTLAQPSTSINYYIYNNTTSRLKQNLSNSLNASTMYAANTSASSLSYNLNSNFVNSVSQGPCYMQNTATATAGYTNQTDGIYGDFIELEFKDPVTLTQFSFSSDGTGRRYPRYTMIIGSNTLDANDNIVYDKSTNSNIVFGPIDAGGNTTSYNVSADDNLFNSTSSWYSIIPTTTDKFKYFRFIVIAAHSDWITCINNIAFKVSF